jgi:hypothetical protein
MSRFELGRIAYEACPGKPHTRTPWDSLAPHWRDYWADIAEAVRKAVANEKAEA